MALSTHQQAAAIIARSNHTLVCFPEHAGGDGVASALGLALALEQMRPGHQVDVVSSGFTDDHRARYGFLPGVERVRDTARREQTLKIRIPCDDPNACDIRTTITDGAVEVTLRASGGGLSPSSRGGVGRGVVMNRDSDHISHSLTSHSYDAVIVVDAPDLASLGALYRDHAAMFQSTPTIVIDHAPDHERYGQVHVIDVTASSCGEVAAALLRDLPAFAPPPRRASDGRSEATAGRQHVLDADVATCLLTGILVKTRSFRTPRMGPKTFEVVGYLLECGAKREEIVTRLFQTKTVAQLQLWGRALTRLKHDAPRGLVWTIISQHDFLTVGATSADLPELVDELLASSPDAQCVLLLVEQPDRSVRVTAASPRGRHDAAHLLRPLGGTGSAALATATLPAIPLPEAEKRVIATVQTRAD